MRESIALAAATMTWDPETRVFDYEASPPGATRQEKEELSLWMEQRAGQARPFGLLVRRYRSLRGERISGFSMSELVRLRGRIVVAIVQPARNEEIMIPVVSTLTGVAMACFPDRAAAEAWLRRTLEGPRFSPYTSPRATP